jgi:hypothetical protein
MNKGNSNPAKTMLTITVGFILVYFFTKKSWAFSVSLIVGLIGILSDYLSRKIDFIWMKLSWLLSLIVPNIILTVIYFIVLFPLSLLSKLFQKTDSLRLKNTGKSNFIDTSAKFDKSMFERTW